MTDDAKREVVSDEVGSRKEEEHAGGDEAEGIDDQPEPVLLEIASELTAQEGHGSRLFEVVWKKETGRGLPAEMPQQALFGDALGDIAKRARLDAAGGAAWRCVRVRSAPLAFRFRQHRGEALFHAAKKAGRLLFWLRLR